MIVGDAIGLQRHHQSAAAHRVLRGDAGRTAIGVAAQRLDTAQREHEAARRIAPVGAERHGAGDIEGGRDLAGRADLDAVARADADQRVVHEVDALAHRHAEMVHELEGSRASAAFLAVDHDEIRIDTGLQHRLADREKLPGMADAQLEAGRLAAGQPAHLADELNHLDRRRERLVIGRRDAVLAHRHTANPRNLFRHFRRRQHAAVAGLGALADLQFDHLDLRVGGARRELLRVEGAVLVAATEIAGADFPDQVAAHFLVIGTEAALAGVMGEVALLRAGVECAHRVRAERAKAHRGDVEHRGRIGFRAIRPADGDAKMFFGVRLRRHRMVHPFVALFIDVALGAKRALVEHHLGALIDQSSRIAAERHAVLFALEEILPHLRPDLFQQEAQMRRDRIVAQHRMVFLQEIVQPEHAQPAEHQDRYHHDVDEAMIRYCNTEQQQGRDTANGQHDEARREGQQKRFHESPLFNGLNELYTISGDTGITTRLAQNDKTRAGARVSGCDR